MFTEILIIISLTSINGLLAMSEMAIVSTRKSRLEQMANQGVHGARAAMRLVDDPSRFLSTVQIGITLIGIVAGAYSGATLGERLADWLNTFPLMAHHGEAIGIGFTVICITYLSLIVGELVPKRVALAQPEKIASFVAGPMRGLSMAAAPAVWLLHVSTELALRLMRLSGSRESAVTEDEVKSLIAEGTQAGVFELQEQEMIEGVLRLSDRPVRIIMTPRSDIVWIDVNAGRDAILDMAESNRLSRLLVCDEAVDHPVGVVHSKDLLPKALRGGDVTLSDLMTPVLFVPDRVTVLNLLDMFKREKMHMAVVVNEYGGTEGLATPTDVLESIAGDLPEQGEDSDPGIVKRDDGSWLVDGSIPMDEIEEITGVNMGGDVKTMAGFMLHHLKRMPMCGASFNYGNARFEVVDMDRRRIDKVLIEIMQNPSGEQKSEPDG